MSADDPLIGRTLGEFQLQARIGSGGFGAVYRAHQPLLDRQAVVKVLHRKLRSDADSSQRFLREARIASHLDHPYAAHIYAFGVESDGLLWIAMELVRGRPLSELLTTQGSLPLERFVPLYERICEVVQAAHEQGIVHRDLKPSNVMVMSRAGRLLPKLLDFGIAKALAVTLVPTGEVVTPRMRAPGDPTPTLTAAAGALVDTLACEDGEMDAPSKWAGSPAPSADLTQRGAMLGSPSYMAPEQWSDPSSVDARCDIYALGVLAYQALTGHLPFQGATYRAIEAAHAREPVPALGPGFSARLDEVLARALAKDPAQRIPDALTLASSFRAAAGLASDRVALPELDDNLRGALIAGAPQPIAEAVAALEAARNLHQARDAAWMLFRVVVRYLALVALACQTRLGPLAAADLRALGDALRLLHRRGLDEAEWVELARQLCRPFVDRVDLYPVPELATFLLTPASEPLAELLALQAESEGARSEAALRTHLERTVAALERLLRGLGFLTYYPLVIAPGANVAELWMGVRRSQRTTLQVRGKPLAAGQVALLDPDGVPVLSLSPLFALASPSQGTPAELFLLDGRGRHGARFIALPLGFERHDEAVWDWLRAQLPDSVDEARTPSEHEPTPYRGLSAFSAEDAASFVGREKQSDAFLNRLKLQPLLAVVGPSGAGKSSFVHAGVVPALAEGWRTVSLRPGRAPLVTLEARLHAAGIVAPELARAPASLGEVLRADAAARGPLLLVVDQLEELFTLCSDAGERRRFVEALGAVARSPDDPLRVVLTLRDDFLVRAEQLPALRERLALGMQLLTTPAPEDLRRILVEPAARAGYDFEDPTLPEKMVAEVADHPGALALLSFTAARLWELRDRHFHRLSSAAYQRLGGVAGALAQHAEATLAELSAEQQRVVRVAFRHLVTASGTRAVLTGKELRQLLGGEASGDAVIERLIAARLLVTYEGEGGEETIEIVHESLLAAWPRLVEWQREDAEGARLRDQLRSAARQWDERGRPRGLLWRDDALADLHRWRSRHAGELTASEAAFAAASVADERRGRRLRSGLWAGAFVVLAAGVVGLLTMNSSLDRQRARAETSAARATASAAEARQRLTEQFEEQGRLAFVAGNLSHALVYLNEAYQRGADGRPLQLMLGLALRSHEALVFTLRGHTAGVLAARYSPDGRWIATASKDGTARVWDAQSGAPLALLRHDGPVRSVCFDATGERVLTSSDDGTARVWARATGALLHVLRGHDGSVLSIGFASDGRSILTTGQDGTARLWDGSSGALLRTIDTRQRSHFLAFAPDGLHLATDGADNTAVLWDARTDRAQSTLRGHDDQVRLALFSPDGGTLATASNDGMTRLWYAGTGRLRATLEGHVDQVSDLGFSPDGKLLATASYDRTAKLWDVATGRLHATLPAGTGYLDRVVFDASSTRLLTAGADGSVRLWDVASGDALALFEGHVSVVGDVAFSPDGQRALSASSDGTAKVWDLSGRTLVRAIHAHELLASSATFSPDGSLLLTTSYDKHAHLFGAGDTPRTTVSHEDEILSGSFSPDGARFATASVDKRVRLWDVRTGRLVRELGPFAHVVVTARFSPDGERLLTACFDGTATVWDAATGAVLLTIRERTTGLIAASFSPTGERLVTVGYRGMVRVWDARTGVAQLAIGTPESKFYDAAFSHDGTRLATGQVDGSVLLWDAADGRLLGTLRGHSGAVLSVMFSAHDDLLLTTSMDHSARIWDANTYRELVNLNAHAYDFSRAAFDSGDERVVTAGADGVVRVWDIRRNRLDRAALGEVVRCLASVTLVDGRLLSAFAERPGCAR